MVKNPIPGEIYESPRYVVHAPSLVLILEYVAKSNLCTVLDLNHGHITHLTMSFMVCYKQKT